MWVFPVTFFSIWSLILTVVGFFQPEAYKVAVCTIALVIVLFVLYVFRRLLEYFIPHNMRRRRTDAFYY